MNIEDRLLTMGAAHGRSGKKLTPQGVVIHYVANPGSSAADNRDYFEEGAGGTGSSAHYIIGLKGEIIRCIPESECAAHAGKSYGPSWKSMAKTNNSRFLGIECCHPEADGRYGDDTISSLTELVADICRRYNLDPMRNVYRHYDVCGKFCPLYYVNNPAVWAKLKDGFKQPPAQVIQAAQKQPPAPAIQAAPAAINMPSQWAADAWAWAKKYGLMDGMRPKDPGTREEMASLLYNFYLIVTKQRNNQS